MVPCHKCKTVLNIRKSILVVCCTFLCVLLIVCFCDNLFLTQHSYSIATTTFSIGLTQAKSGTKCQVDLLTEFGNLLLRGETTDRQNCSRYQGNDNYVHIFEEDGVADAALATGSRDHALSYADLLKYKHSTFFTLPRLPFQAEYRSACWWQEVSALRRSVHLACLPTVFLAGFPKCGTTDLYMSLMEHPDITAATNKEPHYWTRAGMDRSRTDLHSYMAVFRHMTDLIETSCRHKACKTNQVTIDGSASTLWDNSKWLHFLNTSNSSVLVAHLIRHMIPAAKFIVVVRDPVERLYSDYMFFRSGSAETFHELVLANLAVFKHCLEEHTLRYCAYGATSLRYHTNMVRYWIGLYSLYIEDYMSVFGHDRVHVLRLEDYSQDKHLYLEHIAVFLNITEGSKEFHDRIAEDEARNQGKKKTRQGPMLEETRRILQQFYSPYNQALATLLNNSHYTWDY